MKLDAKLMASIMAAINAYIQTEQADPHQGSQSQISPDKSNQARK
jgi:hypothetical protein